MICYLVTPIPNWRGQLLSFKHSLWRVTNHALPFLKSYVSPLCNQFTPFVTQLHFTNVTHSSLEYYSWSWLIPQDFSLEPIWGVVKYATFSKRIIGGYNHFSDIYEGVHSYKSRFVKLGDLQKESVCLLNFKAGSKIFNQKIKNLSTCVKNPWK